MRRLGVALRLRDFASDVAANVNEWFTQITERANIQTLTTTPTTKECPENQYGIFKNSTNGNLKLIANDGGTLRTASLFSDVPVVQVGLTAAQSIASGVNTKLNLNAEAYDTGNYFNTGTFRFTPLVAGYYFVVLSASIDLTAFVGNALTACSILKNGAVYCSNFLLESGVNGTYMPVAMALVPMNGTTDFLEGQAFQNSGANRNVNASSDTFFSAFLVRSL